MVFLPSAAGEERRAGVCAGAAGSVSVSPAAVHGWIPAAGDGARTSAPSVPAAGAADGPPAARRGAGQSGAGAELRSAAGGAG